MRFDHPLFFLFLPLVAWAGWWLSKRPSLATLRVSSIAGLVPLADKEGVFTLKILTMLRYLILGLMIVTLARPQKVFVQDELNTQGVDIIIAMDTSGSMMAEDFKPNNRLVESKRVIESFIDKRPHDRLGLVVFGNDAFTQCPLTQDYAMLHELVRKVNIGIAGDGTAIGMGIVTALNRFKTSQAKSKIIILMTDGENNSGQIDPLSASDLAHDLGVKIYTVGIGKIGGAPIPYHDPTYGKTYVQNPDGSLYLPPLDENMLKTIAAKTNGHYFRAIDTATFKDIYNQIDTLEKSTLKSKHYHHYHEYFMPLLASILILVLCEFGITLWLNRLP